MALFRCRRCLYPSSKPDLRFDERGICSACTAYDARASIDWAARERQFVELCRANRGLSHDVVVAVSGGKDSTWQVVKCLELGLRPLAVCASTDHLSQIGRRNLDNIAELCDLVEITPHKPTRRKMAAFALREVGDISWCEHNLIWSVPPNEAINRGIPLVLYGENPQNEYGAGPAGSEKATDLTQEWVHELGGFLGLRLSDLGDILGIEARQLAIYRQPHKQLYRAIFMGQFFPWDGKANAVEAIKHGWQAFPTVVEGSCSNYENLDNCQTGLHDRLRFLKFGYGRACDIASNLIRRGEITRDDAVKWMMYNDGAFPTSYLRVSLENILGPLGVSVDEYREIEIKFTNQDVVDWASRPESFRQFYGGITEPLKEDSSSIATSEQSTTASGFLNVAMLTSSSSSMLQQLRTAAPFERGKYKDCAKTYLCLSPSAGE
jgi:N-acetyl sugar amidotransferase